MPLFRKKPVVIEAFQMTEQGRSSYESWPGWLIEAWNAEPDTPGNLFLGRPSRGEEAGLKIFTLEGVHDVSDGDWIIRGVEGEIYPCKPSIFEATYDPA